MMYGLETVALSKRQEAELEVAEMKMLRFSLGVTRMDKIRNEQIRGTVKLQIKALASDIFKGKKDNYPQSVRQPFADTRIG
ncbi:hypothetical protein SRHO_G00290090 [Serrasalmus rhombeus]